MAYTLSKSMDNDSAQRDIIPNTYDANNLWGQSDFDVRHVMVINWMYELPVFRNTSNRVLKAWRAAGSSAASSRHRPARPVRLPPAAITRASARTAACPTAASSG